MNYKLVLAACIVFMSSSVVAAEQVELKTQKDKLSYALGINTGKSLKENAIDIDLNLYIQGLKDSLAGKETLLAEAEISAVIQTVRRDIQVRQNKEYLETNKRKNGVIVLTSGLQYRVIVEGKGKSPQATDTVIVNYRGTLINGKEFDSSYKRGKPTPLKVNGVIKGWTEALLLMKEGAKWQLVIPPDLAYGGEGRPGIPPNSVLIFDVELINVTE
jgi:FKBP-type peptidyl-prolyl cis-trans isomerase FklB